MTGFRLKTTPRPTNNQLTWSWEINTAQTQLRCPSFPIFHIQHYAVHFHHFVQMKDQKETWECKVSHIWREGNFCADHIAKESLKIEPGIKWLEEPMQSLRPVLATDIMGVTTPRLVPKQ